MPTIYKLSLSGSPTVALTEQFFEDFEMAKEAGRNHALDHFGRKYVGAWERKTAPSHNRLGTYAFYWDLPVCKVKGSRAVDTLATYSIHEVLVVPFAEKPPASGTLTSMGIAAQLPRVFLEDPPNGTYQDPAREWVEEVTRQSTGGH